MNSNSHYYQGTQKYKQKDFEGAISSFSKALEQEPANAEFFYQRGLSYYHFNKKSLALLDFNEALNLEPENPFRYASRAYIKDSCGDLNGAINDYEKALELDPEDAISFNNLGLLQEKLGYKKKAEGNFKKADKLAENEDFLTFSSKEQEDSATQKANQTDASPVDNEEKNSSVTSIVKDVFVNKSTFREFLTFVKNGFK